MVSGSVVEASHSRRDRESTSRAAKRKPKSLLVDQCGSSLRGFGTQSTRFETSTTEIPGPCYYTDEAQMSFESRTPSFSKKGYCNGFVSTGSHRDDFLSPPSGPSSSCPGQYTLPRGMDYSQKTKNRRGQSLPFLPSPSERVPFQRSSSQIPEAGDSRLSIRLFTGNKMTTLYSICSLIFYMHYPTRLQVTIQSLTSTDLPSLCEFDQMHHSVLRAIGILFWITLTE